MATLSVGGTTVFDGSATQGLTSATTFPAGHIVSQKISTYAADGNNGIATTNTTWGTTSTHLNITHSIGNADNMIIFTLVSSRVYIDLAGSFLLLGVGLTSDLSTNIIDYSLDGPGSTQHDNGKIGSVYCQGPSGAITHQAISIAFKYFPGTTVSKIYQPIQYASGTANTQLVNGNSAAFVHFILTEVVV